MVQPLKLGHCRSRHGRRLGRPADRAAARRARRRAAAGRSRWSRSAPGRAARTRGIDLRKLRWVADPVALATDPEIDVFVELIGGEGDPAKAAVEAALAAGKSVVTANKALLARHGVALARLAEKNRVALNFEAAVAGGIPIVKTLREGLAGNSVARIYGILNGTCNYILTRMEQEKLSFDECLKEAQRLGYAEADPTFDVEGYDTAQKLAILASLAFGTKVDPDRRSMSRASPRSRPTDLDAADELGYRIKLLGVAVQTDKGIEQRVHPTMVPKESAIAQVMGVTNAVTVDAEAIAPITLVGPGAGGMATASAVVADIGDIARGVRTPPFGRPTSQASRAAARRRCSATRAATTSACSRVDRPGTAATIARRLAQQNISLESIVQRHRGRRPLGGGDPRRAGDPVPVILITYATTEDAVRKALAAVEPRQGDLGRAAGDPHREKLI